MTRRAARLVLLAALLAASCVPRPPPTPAPPRLTLAATRFSQLPGWSEDHVAAALPAFLESCAVLAKMKDRDPVGPDGMAGTAVDWRGPCADASALSHPDDATVRRFLEGDLVPFMVGNNGAPEGLFTGYYEPLLNGSRHPGGVYSVPLLRRPPDLLAVDLGQFRPAWRGDRIAGRVVDGRLRPYPTRAEIERGALNRYHLGFLWVDSAVDAFFLSVQGSGEVRLPDGSLVGIGYDGENGQPYVPIGRLLVERGVLAKDEVSLAAIRAWIAAHPAEGRALMDADPSYVFFRETTGEGPIGTEGVRLTPGRSLAVDAAFLPLGAPVWVDIAQGDQRWRRLMVTQDTGGAIKGPVRGDLFWGFGPEAEALAGRMRASGAYYLLLPRHVAQRGPAAAASD